VGPEENLAFAVNDKVIAYLGLGMALCKLS